MKKPTKKATIQPRPVTQELAAVSGGVDGVVTVALPNGRRTKL